MSEDRATRNLRDDITYAQKQLTAAREDGNATNICFWANRRDELLDRFTESRADSS